MKKEIANPGLITLPPTLQNGADWPPAAPDAQRKRTNHVDPPRGTGATALHATLGARLGGALTRAGALDQDLIDT